MTETLEPTLSADLQSLIEKRLDLVDRVLLDGRVSRSERTTILQELEGQILQLVERRSEQPTRDDVLSILSELDPPEAFLSEDDAPSEPATFRSQFVRGTRPVVSEPRSRTSPSPLALWAGFLVSSVSLATAVLMGAAVWFAPEPTLVLVAAIQMGALTGSALGVTWLLKSRSHAASGLERAVAAVAAGTLPLTLSFLMAMAALLYAEGEFMAFILSGFVGGALVHGAWLGVATCLLWLQPANSQR